MQLPTVLVDLIHSFLPPPEPYKAPPVVYFSWDYGATDGWEDVQDVRCYGDY